MLHPYGIRRGGELNELLNTITGPRDWKLRNIPGWINFHLNYEHTGYDYTGYFNIPEREDVQTSRTSPS